MQSPKPFGGTFEVALILLGVISAVETPYFSKVFGDAVSLRFEVSPFLIMVIVWLFKEFYKDSILSSNASLLLTEFCWEIWVGTLAFYMLFFILYSIPTLAQLAGFEALTISLVYGFILIAHYDVNMHEYYGSLKWRLIRALTTILGIVIVYVIFFVRLS